MLATDRGQMWLARWQRTTPSIRAAPTSSGSSTFSLDSMFCERADNEHVRSPSHYKQRHVLVEQEVLLILFFFLWNDLCFPGRLELSGGWGLGCEAVSVFTDALQCWMRGVCLFILQPITELLSDYRENIPTQPPVLWKKSVARFPRTGNVCSVLLITEKHWPCVSCVPFAAVVVVPPTLKRLSI